MNLNISILAGQTTVITGLKLRHLKKRYAKRRMRQNQRDEIQRELDDMDNDY